MNMTERLFEATADVREQANAYAERAVEVAREGVVRAAKQVEMVESPIDVVAKAGLKLNDLSHSYFERMLEQNIDTVKGAMNDGVRRLRLVAKADTLADLYKDQAKYNAVTTDRVVRDAKATWEIVATAGREVSELALNTYALLMRDVPAKTRRTSTIKKTVKNVKARAKKAA
jgi:phasin family protein